MGAKQGKATQVPPTQVPLTQLPQMEVPPTQVPEVRRWDDRHKEREYYALKEKAHRKEIEQLEKARTKLEKKVLDIKIPIVNHLGTSLFKKLRKKALNLEERISKHNDECYAIANLRQAVEELKNKIDLLAEDQKIYLSWLTVSVAMTDASVGVAFVPVIGLIVSPVLVSVPYFGRLIHRLVVSYRRKKQFKKKAIKVN